jgi:hypothetical protein
MSDWHPILAAVEVEPGRWEMRGYGERLYGEIRFVRRGPELGYRAEFVERDGERRQPRYWRSLSAAAMDLHRLFVASHGPKIDPHMLGSVKP